jgi:hypothetical protein
MKYGVKCPIEEFHGDDADFSLTRQWEQRIVSSIQVKYVYIEAVSLFIQTCITMSWKAGLSRYLPSMRFFACPESPSSRGVM